MTAIANAYARGCAAALGRFQVKGAALLDRGIGAARSLGAFGMAPEAFVQGPAAFRAGGALSPRQVFWPTLPGQPIRQALGRLGTVAGAASLPGMVQQDPSESRASRVLGGIGGLAGFMYGGQAGGLLGAPLGMALGRSVGHAAGNLF
jgi:hypothetical protein